MVTGIIGRKVGMTQIFDADGTVHPATVIKAGPVRRRAGEDARRPTATRRCSSGWSKRRRRRSASRSPATTRRPTCRRRACAARCKLARGRRGAEGRRSGAGRRSSPTASASTSIGTGRGKGFQGVVKRHHFAGGAATHGSMFHRAPGSIGASSFPSRVIKGMRAAGTDGRRARHDSQPEGAAGRRGQPPADRRGRRSRARRPATWSSARRSTAKKIKVAQVEKPKKGKK